MPGICDIRRSCCRRPVDLPINVMHGRGDDPIRTHRYIARCSAPGETKDAGRKETQSLFHSVPIASSLDGINVFISATKSEIFSSVIDHAHMSR